METGLIIGTESPAPDEFMAAAGSTVKALGDGKVGGYLVLFGDAKSADLVGDYFTAATDFGLDFAQPVTVTARYHHGMDKTVGKRAIGKGVIGKDDVGVWIEAQLNLRDAYEKAVYQMVSAGKAGWSSSAPGHLIERKAAGGGAQEITVWMLVPGDATITPTPADPRQVVSIKSFEATRLKLEAEPEAPATGAAAAAMAGGTIVSVQSTQEDAMTDNQPAAQESPEQAQIKMLSEQLAQVMNLLNTVPALKSGGYFSQDGGTADAEVKSFGDFLLAVARHDEKRLAQVYKSIKAMSSDAGTTGGYLVPVEYGTEIMRIAFEQSPLLQRVKRVPVNTPAGKYPLLDQYFTPTAGVGETAAAGRVKSSKRAEGGAYTETEAKFEELEWRINDAASGFVKASKELLADSMGAVETLLRDLIGIAVAAKLEYYILRGNGTGEPLGILNASALVNITPDTDNTFAYADAVEMVSRFKSVSGGMWLHHPSILTDIANFQIGANSGAVFVTNQSASLAGMPLLGYPVYPVQHLPQADASGCVVLIDPTAYVLFEKGGLYIDYSEHADFLNGNDVWRFGYRCDGQPWVKSAITLSGPGSAFTQSPFINFND